MTQLTIGLLPQQKVNYRALLTSFVMQSMLVAVLIKTGVIQPVKLIKMSKTLIYTPIVIDSTPKFQPSVRGYIPPVVAKLVVPKPSPTVKPLILEPPKVEMQSKSAPALPAPPAPLPKPIVQVGAFLPTQEKPTLPKSTLSSQVQTGGFGDPNGVKGVGDGKSKLTVASLGSFGMPSGPGYGNGTGGAHGKTGVGGAVQASGFDSTATGSLPAAKVPVPHDTGKPVEILDHIKPTYTEEGRRRGIQGEVLLRVKLTANGQVSILKVLQGLGFGLDEQACSAAERIKFKPAEHNGQPIDSEVTVHVIFELAS